jgi:hypothetical protein
MYFKLSFSTLKYNLKVKVIKKLKSKTYKTKYNNK